MRLSEWGVRRGMVSQSDEEGQEHPVANFSRKHATIEKECLDVKLGVQYFRVYMLGWPFVVETDHQSLQRLYHMKDNNTRSTRWSLGLQPNVFTVKHWKEKNDGLSRLPNWLVYCKRSEALEGGVKLLFYQLQVSHPRFTPPQVLSDSYRPQVEYVLSPAQWRYTV